MESFGDPDAHNNLGNVLRNMNRVREAKASYTKAIELKPDFHNAHNNLGNALKESDKLKEAKAGYIRALQLRSDYPEAHSNLGVVYERMGLFERAEASYSRAIALDPSFVEAHYNVGNSRQRIGKFEEAETHYEQVISLQPDNASAKHMFAALSGTITKNAPHDYADSFDVSLVTKLGYRTPTLLKDMIAKEISSKHLGSIIDLGCGTGLFGGRLRHGVKISKGSIYLGRCLWRRKRKIHTTN